MPGNHSPYANHSGNALPYALPNSPMAGSMYSSGSDPSSESSRIAAANRLVMNAAPSYPLLRVQVGSAPHSYSPASSHSASSNNSGNSNNSDSLSPNHLVSKLGATSISSTSSVAPSLNYSVTPASSGAPTGTVPKRGGGISCHHCKVREREITPRRAAVVWVHFGRSRFSPSVCCSLSVCLRLCLFRLTRSSTICISARICSAPTSVATKSFAATA